METTLIVLALAAAFSPALTVYVVLRLLPARSTSVAQIAKETEQEDRRLAMAEQRSALETKLGDIQAQKGALDLEIRRHQAEPLLAERPRPRHPNVHA